MQPFDYRGVHLLPGPLTRVVERILAFYCRVPNDDWLRGFRLRAGRPAPGVELGGWYSRDNGNIFGQVVSALSRAFAATGDPALHDKVALLIDEWGACLGADNYPFYSHQTTGKAYTFDKLVGGLVDAGRYAGLEQVRPLLCRLVDWGTAHLDRTRAYANADGEGAPHVGGSEWYTLAENLYRAFQLTGDERFRDFAAVWHYAEYWEQIARGADIWAPRPGGAAVEFFHAYSHVNTFASAAAAYTVTSDPDLLQTLRSAYDFVQAQAYATGGYGPKERLLPADRFLPLLSETKYHFETQCGTWAACKLAKALLTITGDARYGDWIERLLYNAFLASLPISDDGRVFYYSSYKLDGGFKELYDDGWACCAGTHPQIAADLHDLIYFHGTEELLVNLFVPSVMRWECRGVPVTLQQQTEFPTGQTTTLRILPSGPVEFTLRIRCPGWLAAPPVLCVNGAVQGVSTDAQHTLALRRTWSAGDWVELELPQGLHAQPVLPRPGVPAAMLCGPVVLAVRSTGAPPHGRIDMVQPADILVPTAGEPCTWRVRGTDELLVRPYHAFREREPYFMYLQPAT